MILGKEYFGVIGCPVLHSKSPQIINSILSAQNADNIDDNHGHYTRIAVTSAQDALFLFKEMGLKGINVTSPLKAQVLPYLNSITPDALQIGAVNTVVMEDGVLKGYNTDHIGVVMALKKNGFRIEGSVCLVLGAGDAGRAAAYGLKNAGAAKVIIANRTYKKAVKAGKSLGCDYVKASDLPGFLLSDEFNVELIISALPSDVQLIKKEWLKSSVVVFDAVYNHSRLTDDAASVGCKVIRGEEWLLNQAVPAYEHFTKTLAGFPLPDEVKMKSNLYEIDHKPTYKKNVVLIGFSGVGKTVVAEYLAKELGYDYIDTDMCIEAHENMSIDEIFSQKSEPYFRFLESKILRDIAQKRKNQNSTKGMILSCGGGIILDRENCKLLKTMGTVVWLYSSVKTSVSRLSNGTRPLLRNLSEDGVLKMFESRRSLYFESSDLVVNSEYTIKEVSDKIKDEILSMCY